MDHQLENNQPRFTNVCFIKLIGPINGTRLTCKSESSMKKMTCTNLLKTVSVSDYLSPDFTRRTLKRKTVSTDLEFIFNLLIVGN